MNKMINSIPQATEKLVFAVENRLQHSSDLMAKSAGTGITLIYFESLVDKTMLHQDILRRGNYAIGKDPVLPILKKRENLVKISGLALFKDNKMVGKLSFNKSYYIRTLQSPLKSGEFEIPISGELLGIKGEHLTHKQLAVALDTVFSKPKIELINKENLEFNLKLKINARIQEINAEIDLQSPKNVHLLEKEIAMQMEEDIKKLIAYSQSVESDPIGFGEAYRRSVRHSDLTREKWHKMFPKAKVHVDVDFTIVKTGIVE